MEAAASRLEDVTIFQEKVIKGATPTESLLHPTATASSSFPLPAATPSAGQEEIPESIKAFDRFLDSYVNPFVAVSSKIDPLVEKASKLFEQALVEERKFLLAASK